MYGLRLSIVILQELQCLPNLYMLVSSELLVSTSSSMCLHLQVFGDSKMYCVRILIVLEGLLQRLPLLLCVSIEKHVYTKCHLDWFCFSELHTHLCPYHKVWSETIYCCFIITTMFTICYYQQSYGFLSLHQVLFVYTFHFLR